MRTTQAARYARWAASAALIFAAVVAGVYLRGWFEARKITQSAPPPVPKAVQQRSAEFSFSQGEKGRTIFTVRAAHATAFKEGSKNLLEDVWITIYGRSGQRADNIHTQACEYFSDKGQVTCAGKVQIDLESAADAKKYGKDTQNPQAVRHMEHVETSNLSFSKNTGFASTDRQVDFRFPDGEGRATGLTYDSRENILRLVRDVQVTFHPRRDPVQTKAAAEPVLVTGSSLEYHHNDRLIRLKGPVHVQQSLPVTAGTSVAVTGRELRAGELAIELDNDYHVQRLTARPEAKGEQVELHSSEPSGENVLTADELVAYVHPAGWIERAQANGSVHASVTRDSGQVAVSAAQMELEFLPGQNQPQQIEVRGGVTALTNRNGRFERLETAALRLSFVNGNGTKHPELDHAETLAPATLEWQVPGAAGQPAREITKLVGQQLTANFAARGLLKNLGVKNGLTVERRVPDRPVEFSSAREADVKFDADGEWTQVDEEGGVHAREGTNSAQADHAKIDRAADLLTLTGSVDVTDGEIRMTSQTAIFNQRTADFHADTHVLTTLLKSDAASVANLAPQAAFLISDQLDGNSSGGRATYTGHARLWQGDSVIEADTIEMIRDAQRLAARGNVAAAFIQQAGSSPVSELAQTKAQTSQPDLWRIHAAILTYWSREQRALLDGGVRGESSQASIASKTLELFFAPSVSQGGIPSLTPRNGMPLAGTVTPRGSLQISKADASGGVVVKQSDRKGVSDRAIFDAAEQKFVLSGGNPTIYDGPRGTTTGRQLTFFFASDKIIVDSEEGSRTLTRHRVEK